MSPNQLYRPCTCNLCTADGTSRRMILNTEWNEHRKQAERASSRLSESDEQTSPDDHPDTDIRRLVFGMTLNDRLGSQIGDYGGSSSDTIHVAPTTTNDSTEDPIFDVSGLVAAVDVIVNDTKAKTAHKGSENLKKVPVIGSIVRPLKNAVELKLSGAINHIATTKAMNRLKKAQGDLDSIQTRIVGTDTEILESHEDLQTSIVTIRQEVEFIKRDVPNVQALRSEVLRALDEAETSLQSRVCNLGDPSHSEKEMTPLRFNSEHHFRVPVDMCDTIARVVLFLAVYCSVIINVSRRHANFIINCLSYILQLVFMRCREGPLLVTDSCIIDEIPKTIDTALRRFNLDKSVLVTYAVCPACNCIHPPIYKLGYKTPTYPQICGNASDLPKSLHDHPCSEELTHPNPDPNGKSIPYKVFSYYPLQEYIAALLSRPDIETMIDEAFDRALAEVSSDPKIKAGFFDGEFVRTFRGPDKEKLFIDRGNETRILFSLNVDFFNVNMNLQRGASSSCGIISMACLNLPADIRYKPENMYLAGVTPGPSEPSLTQFNHFLRPLMSDLATFWKRGVMFSRTAHSPTGKIVRVAVAVCVCDLPAARKLCGFAGVRSNHYCTSCTSRDRKTLGNTNVEAWVVRDDNELETQANAWRDAQHEFIRAEIFDKYGVRYSPIWLLGYLKPATQLVPDPMHCLLENLASNHFRDYLCLTTQSASAKDEVPPVFHYDFQVYDPTIIVRPVTGNNGAQDFVPDQAMITRIKDILNSVDPATLSSDDSELIEKLKYNSLPTLRSICVYLGIQPIRNSTKLKTLTKADYARGLIESHKKDMESSTPNTMDPTARDNKPEDVVNESELRTRSKEVANIHKILTAGTELDRGEIEERLERKSRNSLEFVLQDLEQKNEVAAIQYDLRPGQRVTKAILAKKLVDWRMSKVPNREKPVATVARIATMETLKFIRQVINDTSTPTWMNSVPKEFGEKKAGTLKADEWRTYATVFLPIALVLLWGEGSKHSSKESAEVLSRHLDHTMSLVQAIILACYRVTTEYRINGLQTHLKVYLTELRELYPDLNPSTNQHMSLHLAEFMKRFGPVHSWWTYPFERLIGLLQKLPTNNKFGELESTLVESFFSASLLRRWLARTDQPEEVRAILNLLAKSFPPERGTNYENTLITPQEIQSVDMEVDQDLPEPNDMNVSKLIRRAIRKGDSKVSSSLSFRKRVRINGAVFSVKETHLGNSIVEFYLPGARNAADIEVGVIEYLVNVGNLTFVVLRKHLPVTDDTTDPFSKYIDFPGKLYSAQMSEFEVIEATRLKSHVVRFPIPDSSNVVIVSLSRY